MLCLEEGDPVERTNVRCAELAQSFLKSQWAERVQDELAPYVEAFQNTDHRIHEHVTTLTYHTGPFTQVSFYQSDALALTSVKYDNA